MDYNLHKLQAMGYLKREPEVSRGIELIGEGLKGTKRDIQSIPVMGSIAAGEPLHVPDAPAYAEESYDTIDLPSSLIGERENMFALRVKGTSMIDALVADGDLVILEPANDARNGEMVAAWLDGSEETTLKRFYIEGDMVRLQPRKRLDAANHGRRQGRFGARQGGWSHQVASKSKHSNRRWMYRAG